MGRRERVLVLEEGEGPTQVVQLRGGIYSKSIGVKTRAKEVRLTGHAVECHTTGVLLITVS